MKLIKAKYNSHDGNTTNSANNTTSGKYNGNIITLTSAPRTGFNADNFIKNITGKTNNKAIDLTGKVITAKHLNDLLNVIKKEYDYRAKSFGAETDFTTVVNGSIFTKLTKLSDLITSNYFNTLKTEVHKLDDTDIYSFSDTYKTISKGNNYKNLEDVKVNTLIKSNYIFDLLKKVEFITQECLCNCNYCACNCNYCSCQCNYSCTCQCNYNCTCNCNYTGCMVHGPEAQICHAHADNPSGWQPLTGV